MLSVDTNAISALSSFVPVGHGDVHLFDDWDSPNDDLAEPTAEHEHREALDDDVLASSNGWFTDRRKARSPPSTPKASKIPVHHTRRQSFPSATFVGPMNFIFIREQLSLERDAVDFGDHVPNVVAKPQRQARRAHTVTSPQELHSLEQGERLVRSAERRKIHFEETRERMFQVTDEKVAQVRAHHEQQELERSQRQANSKNAQLRREKDAQERRREFLEGLKNIAKKAANHGRSSSAAGVHVGFLRKTTTRNA
ncbi:hypothetical protein M427DRAFT_71590 [Gonapodya prolifera JEL478]|uniref:Uncharacterized protein n=1 Tax=Gonapodya prolifera (strain JEL478) TaxID=1344416 RepID=A0A139A920_GONPJ|nr:hypothetical protein M427DRAFT_71590 [Gonapodya prolifera JEL478]|eukprot:KXS13204.1 hypothetical protein M427DRAFT_71590 [Gonapodya prolifera JEL478]